MAKLADATTSIASGSETPRGGWGFVGLGGWGSDDGVAVRDDADGAVSPPCEFQWRRGLLRTILWRVAPGSRTFKIWCRHSGHAPRPRVVVKADPRIGVMADVVVEATASLAWQEITVGPLTIAVAGVLEVWREVRAVEQGAYAKWDDVTG